MHFRGAKSHLEFVPIVGQARLQHFPIGRTFVAAAHLSGGHDDPLGAVVWPWGSAGVSATTFKIGTGLYFIVMAMISSAIGGYIAGRLRTKWTGVHRTRSIFVIPPMAFLPGPWRRCLAPRCWPRRRRRWSAVPLPEQPKPAANSAQCSGSLESQFR